MSDAEAKYRHRLTNKKSSKRDVYRRKAVKLGCWVIVLGVTAGSLYLIFWLIQNYGVSGELSLRDYVVPVTFSTLNIVIAFAISYLKMLEEYDYAKERMVGCPVLPLIGVLLNIAPFHMFYYVVWKSAKPPGKRDVALRSPVLFKMMLLASLFIALVRSFWFIGMADADYGPHTDERYDTFLLSPGVLILEIVLLIMVMQHRTIRLGRSKMLRIELAKELEAEREEIDETTDSRCPGKPPPS
eukprot:Clim_evm21s146 gene=Clim_evmTU21s146